jgi:hypothetical protein
MEVSGLFLIFSYVVEFCFPGSCVIGNDDRKFAGMGHII